MGSKIQDFPHMVLRRGESSRVDVGENSLSSVEERDFFYDMRRRLKKSCYVCLAPCH